ncbi:MAG TPA: uroporphyrinogen-III synthase, partial [Chondromyces sp.]|nr:uroporphyrinogen-III synthase [Chondromyces sp.]
KGLFAKHAVEMNKAGKLLIIGEEDTIPGEFKGEETLGMYHSLITSKKIMDDRFVPVQKRVLEEAALDTIVFPSSASVHQWIQAVKKLEVDSKELIKDKTIICLGSQTKKAAKQYGFSAVIMPDAPTPDSLVECLASQSYVL